MSESLCTFGGSTYSSSLISLLVAQALVACGGDVQVGEAKETPSPVEMEEPKRPVETPSEPSEEDCTQEFATKRASYDAWQASSNQLGVLAGKTLSGYIEGGEDLLLTIQANGTAVLQVGDPVFPAQAGDNYLCDSDATCDQVTRAERLATGATYPLHGATFVGNRLRAELQQHSPWDSWCALQTPVFTDTCFYAPAGLGPTVSIPKDNYCSLDGVQVGCGWLALSDLGVCTCTASECFASIYSSHQVQLDLRYDESAGELRGSYGALSLFFAVEP